MSTSVFFFGGYKASQDNIDVWLRSARQLKPDIDFIGFPWPSGTASAPADVVVKGSKTSGLHKSAVEAIQACKAVNVYIVGHSSGCAIANAVDKELNDSRVVLVALDGYSPNDDQLQRKTTQVWGAMCGKVKSKNFPGWSRGRQRIYQATGCKQLLPLHFSVVNTAARDGKVISIATGYLECKANLEFLA